MQRRPISSIDPGLTKLSSSPQS